MRLFDAVVAAMFLAIAFGIGAQYAGAARRTKQTPDMPGLSRRIFGAAAMVACGRGATTPVVPPAAEPGTPDRLRALAAFLDVRRDAISCADIPVDVPVDGLDGPQRASRYLLLMTAGAWKLSGLSWAGIDRLVGLLFGMAIALAYLAGRLALTPIAAAAVASLYMLSPLHLANLLDLRDYSKAPFFVATLLIAGVCVLRPRAPRTIVACAAAAGALIGCGFGVRTDIALNLAVVLGAVGLFLPGHVSGTWKLRVAAAAVCMTMFLAAAAPILGSGASGSNLWHWALLGYSHDSDEALDVAPAPYETGYFYSDSYVATVVDASWGRSTGSAAHVSVGLPGYADASRRYYLLLLETFPADALLRGWASVIRVLELPYGGAQSIPGGWLPRIVNTLVSATQRALSQATGVGVPLFALVAIGVSMRSVRLAAFMCALAAFLGAYPAIQFHPRHIFHLELLPLWLLGFAVSWLVLVMSGRTDPLSLLGPAGDRRARRPLLFVAAVLAIVVLPWTALRAYQQRTATALLSTYEDATREPMAMSPAPIDGGRVRLALNGGRSRAARRSIWSEMLAVEIGADRCPDAQPSLTFRYRAADPAVDFSRSYAIDRPAGGGVTTVYFPAYETGAASPDPALLAIDGLEIAAADWPCVKRVSRFADADRFPLLLAAVLPAHWRELPLHQTLRRWRDATNRPTMARTAEADGAHE